MCTAFSCNAPDHYFGRNLDLDRSYGERVCILPRNYPLAFCRMGTSTSHHALIGMALEVAGTALFYDGANEKGLCMAGLNFPDSARYLPETPGMANVSPYELIPWVLTQCATAEDAWLLLERTNPVNIPFSSRVPLAPLHWLVSDGNMAFAVEPLEEGLTLRRNPLGVLTNEPPLPIARFHLNQFRNLSAETLPSRFAPEAELADYCLGLGAVGLPGDLSSLSRFVRGAFHRGNALWTGEEEKDRAQFFHLLSSVEVPAGSCIRPDGAPERTVYASCIHAPSGRYYYRRYYDPEIHQISLRDGDLESSLLQWET